VHSALRRSAAEGESSTGSRRLASNNTISAANAKIVTKKNKSFRTIGPMIAISVFEDGMTPLSESSCNPAITSCAATRRRIAVVTRKNFCRLIRTLPFTNITPKAIAHSTPSSVPRKLISSVEFSVTAERISTVSAPSRSTIRKTKKKRPIHASLPASKPTLPSIWPFSLRPVFIMKITMVMTKKGHQHDPAFKRIFVKVQPRHQYRNADAPNKSGPQRGIDGLAQIIAPNFGEIGQSDPNNQGGLNPFAQRDNKSLKHLDSPYDLENEFQFQL